ncbi:formylglycine-generating enzyme family protein [Streptomyces yaizuensis]|uniref:SUMF1/EgtB/PvdO family nonheme iron enzyme n=1 Tax=Streptomyces yaizuensis TaxID=2989713 RepID=A0ABQ5NRQ4_9ACTN|nr:SUMF1/EgtB/PvdO family nonheme iron enzyme [Streptomyces sp. YSPA8]GLF92843.1 SUMF1/EgtB/PvdO family nonheme iron enzyme [Streptomyces sp. YSPA8]
MCIELPGAAALAALDDAAHRTRLELLRKELSAEPAGPELESLLCRSATGHADWNVRRICVETLATRFHDGAAAREAICAATHDDVDWVAFTAINAVHALRMPEAAAHLIRISGWPSNFSRPAHARKPVGCGAALTKRALWNIFGSRDPGELRRLEDEHFAGLRAQVDAERVSPDLGDAVLVPGGPSIAGARVDEVGPFLMDDTDSPLRVIELPSFLIDRTTVTNERYGRFLDAVRSAPDPCRWAHPDQPEGKDHTPAHWRDPRFNAPGHPVVGVDWYDAYAFARWAGGRLPSEDEWEKAARGTDGRRYPWGDTWDTARARSVETAYPGEPPRDLDELEALLVRTSLTWPPEPVVPADSLPGGASPCGALNMAGNVWEITRTNFFSRQDMAPFFRGRTGVEFMNRPEAFHVLKGGTWTSPPVCLTTYYRGKDLLTDRHNEVGFRCVYTAPENS